MSLHITDLSFDRETLATLTDAEIITIVGGNGLPTIAGNLQGYNAAYSLSIANLNKVNILTVGSGASFNAAFSVGKKSQKVVTGSISYNAQVDSPYLNARYA